MPFRTYILLFFLCLLPPRIFAQQLTTNAKRYEIDMKRIGLGLNSKDALVRGREFIRIDSTYYIGWMYKGAYEMEHAADILGYQIAANTLQKSLTLLQKEFTPSLMTRTSDLNTYIDIAPIHRDWDFIQYALFQCYSNANQVEKAWNLLEDAQKVNLQDEFMTETYNSMAWMVHRYRLYKPAQFSFLKNTIKENEAYAHALLDSSLQKIIRDQALMQSYLIIDYRKEREPGIWHYRSILHGYNLAIPYADTCYARLRNTPYFPWNNYATFNLIQGKFDSAASYYKEALKRENSDKRLNESHYYLGILNAYSNNLQPGIHDIVTLIKQHGSSPGYGWYQLALSRLYLMHGEFERAQIALNKAEAFEELHLGTTLGITHYQFTINTLQQILWQKKLQWLSFSDRYWYLKPNQLLNYLIWRWKLYFSKISWVNRLKLNQEREEVLYQLLASESTVGFNEILSGLDDVSPKYYEKLFKQKLAKDSIRPNLIPFWHFALAKQLMNQKKWKEAQFHLETILNNSFQKTYSEYHRLLIALTYKSLIACLEESNQKIPENLYCKWIESYPQTIMESEYRFPIRIEHTQNKECEKAIALLKHSKFILTKNTKVPLLNLSTIYKNQEKYILGTWHLPEQEAPLYSFQIKITEKLNEDLFFQKLWSNNTTE